MPTTPPRPSAASSWESSETPATPDTPYHSVKESHTDISDFSDDGSIDHFSDATEGRDRSSLEDPFGRDTFHTNSLNTANLEPHEEDEDCAHTPHVEQLQIIFPISQSFANSTMSSEDSEIPQITVDRTVDDHPVYGTEDHPNKEAYEKRKLDAEPDIEREYQDTTTTAGDPNVPTLVVEKTADDHDVYGTVQGTDAYDKRAMDAQPDILREYQDTTLTNGHPNPKASPSASPLSGSPKLPASGPSEGDPGIPPLPSTAAVPETFADEGDDDFDDFGETVKEDDGFDDFGDFDSADPMTQVEASHADPANYHEQVQRPSFPDFTKMTADEMMSQIDEIISSLYPRDDRSTGGTPNPPPPLPPINSAFLTERSQSLWTQLCTPPPLQPPNWKLSRIRRLFLVSLGVPVDLDEILPAGTKQKKLVLPSSSSARKSSETGRGDNDKSRRSTSRRRKDKDAPAKLVDIPSARILCSTSDVKLRAFTVDELNDHLKKLEEVTKEASETLTYWLGRRETAMGDKEAFESVIENLVVFAKKKR